jgi:hypothetical protein
MTDRLEQTLEKMDFALPAGLVDRAISGAAASSRPSRSAAPGWKRPRNFLVGFCVASILLIAANALAAYFAPRYGQALADTPGLGAVAGPVLHFSGLDASAVTPLNEAVTSSGHMVKLIGAYADSERTVVFLEVDGQPHVLPTKQQSCCIALATLTDQFGHAYQQIYSVDALAPNFSPLVQPASQLGARLTLHISDLLPAGPGFTETSGAWELHLTLIQQAGIVLPIPPPVTANGVTYTFTSLHLSRLQIKVTYTLSGPLVDQQRQLAYAPGAQSSPPGPNSFFDQYTRPRLVNAAGVEAFPSNWGMTLPKKGPAVGELTAVLPGPGRYVLTLGDLPGGPTVQIEVPDLNR